GGKVIQSNGLLVATDRLGSVRANESGETFRYKAYGDELTSTAQSREKYGTYYRDTAGLDYADQRYYGTTGAFLKPEIYKFDPAVPAKWNGYAYVQGDPINFNNPHGVEESESPCYLDPFSPECSGYTGGGGIYDDDDDQKTGGSPVASTYKVPGTNLTIWNPSHDKSVDEAWTKLKDAILNDPDCMKWINTSSKTPTSAAFSKWMDAELSAIGYAAISDPAVAAISNTSSYVPNFDMLINTSGGFYNGNGNAGYLSNNQTISRINFNTDRFREFTILHELGHLLQIPGFLGNDTTDATTKQNNNLIGQNCQKTILSFTN